MRTVKTITGKIEDLRSLIIFGASVLPWGVPHDIRGVTGSETRTPTAPSATEPYRYTDRQAHCSAGNGAVNNNRIKSSKPYEPREPCIRWHAPPGLSGVRVTEYKFPARGVQGRWRQTLTPAPPSTSEPDRHTVCRGRKGNQKLTIH